MAVSTPPSDLVIRKWRKTVWRDYQRDNLFADLMGNGDSAVIHRFYELKDDGEEIVIPLAALPDAEGVVGDQTLVGNEHDLKQYGHALRIDWWRDAVLLNKKQMRRSVTDQLEEVRPALTQIAANRLRDDVIRSLWTVTGAKSTLAQGTGITSAQRKKVANINGVYYPYATTAQKNAWHDANRDRIQYGALRSNFVTGDHAASLANVDAVNDRFIGAAVRTLKRLAKKAKPKIHPVQIEGGREYFVVACGTNAFRDFSQDPEVVKANTDARARGVDSNPIFQDGDLILNGMMVREVPEIDDLTTIVGVGAAAINVTPVFVLGRQALGYAVGQLPKPTERAEDDYGFVMGRGIETCYGMGKIQFVDRELGDSGPVKDWGVVTGFYASVDDQ